MLLALFQPRYQKEAFFLAKNARKILHRHKDRLKQATIDELNAGIDRLEAAARAGNQEAIKEQSEKLDKEFARFAPSHDDVNWRENCEVLLVAFVVAIAIRAYFLQPFKIPTGSMQPTLNGIIGHRVEPGQPLPGKVSQFFQSFLAGRTYVDATAEADDVVVDLFSETTLRFFTSTRIRCRSGRNYSVRVPVETLRAPEGFGVTRGTILYAGKPIARGYVDTGDQVFVDKLTYHFRAPRRGDVFVFNTAGIAGLHMQDADPLIKSQFYIKRLAGLPLDTLRVDQPKLFLNNQLASEPGFVRVMSLANGYNGYSQGRPLLQTSDDTYTVPAGHYFAMGDNSFHSYDSRFWGPVPARSVVGRGLFVYWPFTKHWGAIR